jgi:hypothetical protein
MGLDSTGERQVVAGHIGDPHAYAGVFEEVATIRTTRSGEP